MNKACRTHELEFARQVRERENFVEKGHDPDARVGSRCTTRRIAIGSIATAQNLGGVEGEHIIPRSQGFWRTVRLPKRCRGASRGASNNVAIEAQKAAHQSHRIWCAIATRLRKDGAIFID